MTATTLFHIKTRINLCPWYFWNSIIKVPHFWEDDISCVCNENLDNVEVLTQREGLKVFKFSSDPYFP